MFDQTPFSCFQSKSHNCMELVSSNVVAHDVLFLGAGALLLEELVVIFEVDGLRLILEAVQHRLTEAAQAKVQGHVDWWKLREAAILAIGTVAGSLHKAKVGLIPLVFWTHNHSKNLHF
jgi:hypothetical protein